MNTHAPWRRTAALVTVAVLAGPAISGVAAAAEPAANTSKVWEWPRYRGTDNTGATPESDWNAVWPETGPPKLWEASVNDGFGTPVIKDGRIYTFGRLGLASCHDAKTGKEIWKTTLPDFVERKRGKGFAGPTPWIADDALYVYSSSGIAACLETETGKIVWCIDLFKKFDCGTVSYGYCASPAVSGNVVVLTVFDKDDKDKKEEDGVNGPYRGNGGSLLALDRKTGEKVWQNTNRSVSPWSSPLVTTFDGKETIVHDTGRFLIAVDPADGKTLWEFDFKKAHPEGRPAGGPMAATPVILADGRIILQLNKLHSVVCLKIENNTPKILWKQSAVMHWFQSPVVYDGCVYVPYAPNRKHPNEIFCLDLETGKVLWRTAEKLLEPADKRKRMGNGRERSGNTFIVAGGKVLLITPQGYLVSVEVSAEGCKVLSFADVLPPSKMRYTYQSHPVLVDGLLYCRVDGHLICFDVRTKK